MPLAVPSVARDRIRCFASARGLATASQCRRFFSAVFWFDVDNGPDFPSRRELPALARAPFALGPIQARTESEYAEIRVLTTPTVNLLFFSQNLEFFRILYAKWIEWDLCMYLALVPTLATAFFPVALTSRGLT